LIIDPGMGFGKSRRQNYEILAHLRRLQRFRLPILIGTSRKSFVQAIVAGEGLEPPPKKRGTTSMWPFRRRGQVDQLELGDAAAVVASILGGAHIVRVHNVAAILPAVRIADALLSAAGPR